MKYYLFPFLKQAGIKIHFLSWLMVIELLLWNRKERWSIVGDVLFKRVWVLAGFRLS